jgi:hypothetical protein
MKLRLSSISKLLVPVIVAVSMAVLAGGALHASNMGFKMNKVSYILGGIGSNVGDNFTSLPFRNPYMTAQDVCDALGLLSAAPPCPTCGTIQQIEAEFGSPGNHTCGGAAPFALIPRVGVRARNISATVSGILVGSHAGGPPGVTFFALGGIGSGVGDNYFPVLYHGTAATAADICAQAVLTSGTATIQRIDAQFGSVGNYTCGAATPFTLVLGEAVRVRNNTKVMGFVPPHF